MDQQIWNIINGLTSGKLPWDAAVALAHKYKHQLLVFATLELPTVARNSQPTLNSPAGYVIRLLWEVEGATCLYGHFSGLGDGVSRSIIHQFICDRLVAVPQAFGGPELCQVEYSWRTEETTRLIKQIRLQRTLDEANGLLAKPRELNADVKHVQQRIRSYNFSSALNEILDKVESEIGQGDGFDQAATLKHLRTFFERLHAEVATKLHQMKPDTADNTDLSKCQAVIDHLKTKGVLTDKMQALGRALYGVLSNEGVHAIKSEREYVRLCRNMVAEYALVLFFELDRRLQV